MELKPDIITKERLAERGYKEHKQGMKLGDTMVFSDGSNHCKVVILGSGKVPELLAKGVCKFSQLEKLQKHQQTQIARDEVLSASFIR